MNVRVHTSDPVRRAGLAAMLQAAGHTLTDDTPDVELCDVQASVSEAEAPVLVLTHGIPTGTPAGVLPHDVTPEQLDAAIRAVGVGLVVRAGISEPGVGFVPSGFGPAGFAPAGFAPAEDVPALSPREREILGLIGQGLSNKAVARKLNISVHTVKFHLEALFAKLDATSRAEAVAKGMRGGMIEL